MQGKKALVFEALYWEMGVGKTYSSIDTTTDITSFEEINVEWKGFDWDDQV